MQIVIKATKDFASKPGASIGASVRNALGSDRPVAQVSKVFPGVTSGNRSRLFTLDLPDELSESEVADVLTRLRAEDSLEYAELPSAKRPMTSE